MEDDIMKRILILILSALCVFSLCACGSSTTAPEDSSADTAVSEAVAALEASYIGLTEDELTWSYDDASGTITVSGEGPMRDYLETEPEWYQYCDTAEHVVIGDGITSVSPGAFMCFSALNDVSLGETVEFIGDFAFDSCYELRSVNFPSALKYVGEYGFNNVLLHSDSGFVFPEGLLYLGEHSFWSAFKESFVSIPASLTTIEKNAFGNCFVDEFRVSDDNPAYTAENGILYDKGMTTLVNYPADKCDTVYEIPEGVKTVLENAVQVTNNLEIIVIPASVSHIDEAAFYWNYALASVEVDENNKNYTSVDGVLFTKDGKTLLCYPIAAAATEYTIPDGCERIGSHALGWATNLTALSIPEGLKEIGSLGLYGCTGISRLDLPGSLTKIEEQAFYCYDALCEIHYAGSHADWESVEIDEDNAPLFDGTVSIICAD